MMKDEFQDRSMSGFLTFAGNSGPSGIQSRDQSQLHFKHTMQHKMETTDCELERRDEVNFY